MCIIVCNDNQLVLALFSFNSAVLCFNIVSIDIIGAIDLCSFWVFADIGIPFIHIHCTMFISIVTVNISVV